MRRSEKKENFITVPAALRELEKIEMIRQTDGNYRLDHEVTATQKQILMIKKKQDLQGKELLNAFVKSDKNLDEILAFMSEKKDDEA